MVRPVWALLLFPLLSFGCATHAQRLTEVRSAYFAGDLEAARAKIDATQQKYPGETDVFKLDQATVLLGEGKSQQAEKLLREVRNRFDYLEQKDLAEGALAMLTDDQRLGYAGEDYEKVMVRVFLVLANLLSDGQDANAYALQVGAKQQQIIENGTGPDGQNPKQKYQGVAAGAYLAAALREQTHTDYDDAARSLEQVCRWAPEFRPAQQDLQRVRQGHHSLPGNGVLYVFTLVGRGPYKEERLEIPTTAALLVADRILSACGRQTLPPTVAPIKVPRVVTPPNEVQAVGVVVDGRDGGRTETLTDVGRLAVEQAEAVLPYTIGRAVARRAVKKAIVYGTKEALKTEKTGLASLGLDVAGVVWEACEAADTRCWGLLPEKIQVLRVELPAGQHQLALQPVSAAGLPLGLPVEHVPVQIDDGRNTYVLASFPTGRLAGQVVSSRRPQ
jgi:uncharacterized protein